MRTGKRTYKTIFKTAVLIAALVLFLPFCSLSAHDAKDRFFNVDFRFDNAEVDLEYRGNSQTVDALNELFESVGLENVISVQAVSVSSPDGSYSYNIALSDRRAKSTAAFVKERFPELADRISVLPGSESWTELSEAVKNDGRLSEISKNKILDVLAGGSPVNDRKALLQHTLGVDDNVGDVYRYLIKYVYPGLRCSGFSVSYLIGGDTVTVGKTPVILPIENDVPSQLFKSGIDTAVELSDQKTKEQRMTGNETADDTVAAKQSLANRDSSGLDSETLVNPLAEDSDVIGVAAGTAVLNDSLAETAESADPVVAVDEKSVVPAVSYRIPWYFWLLLALLVLCVVWLARMVINLRRENANLRRHIDEVVSQSKLEVERIRNVERVEDLDVDTHDDQLMKSIMEVVNSNISNPDLSVEFIADKIGLSRSYLTRKFKTIVLVPPASFIRDIRMNTAARLLREGKLDINQISTAVGFSSQSSFTTAFKNHFGKTPTDYSKSEPDQKPD